MSARDMILPDQAYADVLAEINMNIMTLERRAEWPGAAHLALGGAVGPTQAGSWILGGGSFSEALLITLTVDPGRWVFFTSVSLSLANASAISWPNGGELSARIIATGSVVASHTAPRLSAGNTGSRQGAITDVVSIDSSTPITAVVRAGGNYASNPIPAPATNGTWSVASSILVAFPG